MKYLLDTNICVYIINQKPVRVIQRLQNQNVNDICISVITLAELEYGVAKSAFQERNKLALAQFLVPFEIIPFSEVAAATYGRIRTVLEKTGSLVGAFDLLIGAQALSENLIVVTNNEKEFRRIPGLMVENWVAG